MTNDIIMKPVLKWRNEMMMKMTNAIPIIIVVNDDPANLLQPGQLLTEPAKQWKTNINEQQTIQ